AVLLARCKPRKSLNQHKPPLDAAPHFARERTTTGHILLPVPTSAVSSFYQDLSDNFRIEAPTSEQSKQQNSSGFEMTSPTPGWKHFPNSLVLICVSLAPTSITMPSGLGGYRQWRTG